MSQDLKQVRSQQRRLALLRSPQSSPDAFQSFADSPKMKQLRSVCWTTCAVHGHPNFLATSRLNMWHQARAETATGMLESLLALAMVMQKQFQAAIEPQPEPSEVIDDELRSMFGRLRFKAANACLD